MKTTSALIAAYGFCVALAAIQLDRFAGLPAHPLLLHVPVVLIPILSGVAVALMARPQWRRRYGLPVAVLGLLALAFTVLTAAAGEAFRASTSAFATPALNEHAELGDQLRVVTALFVAALVGFAIADLPDAPAPIARAAGLLRAPRLERVARAGVAGLAILALVWVVRTGHEGAEVAWGHSPAAIQAPGR